MKKHKTIHIDAHTHDHRADHFLPGSNPVQASTTVYRVSQDGINEGNAVPAGKARAPFNKRSVFRLRETRFGLKPAPINPPPPQIERSVSS